MTLYDGDDLETGRDANATLQFADGTRLLVRERSRLQLVCARLIGGEVSDAEVLLEECRSESQANPDKQCLRPSATGSRWHRAHPSKSCSRTVSPPSLR